MTQERDRGREAGREGRDERDRSSAAEHTSSPFWLEGGRERAGSEERDRRGREIQPEPIFSSAPVTERRELGK